MGVDIRAVTHGPKHHFFGFHDLVEWNATGDLMLGLEVDDISHPPLPGESALSGVINVGAGDFAPVHATTTFNYPQGARQQWLGESDLFLTNDRDRGTCICRISDARSLKVVGTLPFPVHVHNALTNEAFYVNYDRLHRVGGYGYAGGEDACRHEDVPKRCGLYKGDLRHGTHDLLVSLAAVAACGERRPVKTGYPHYVTHLSLNPSKTRLAFLHRYRVVDGGEVTRLMTVGTNGTALRCLAKGFLSHFDWLDDQNVLIWGQDERALCRFREAPWLRLPGLLQMALLAKRMIRLRRRRRGAGRVLKRDGQGQARAFLQISDMDNPVHRPVGRGVLTEDGHPMVNPRMAGILVNDTYPHADRTRTLMLFDLTTGRRVDLGTFRMSDELPDEATFDVEAAMRGLDRRVRRKFPRAQYLFTRSGLHCDLHPRWNAQGTQVAFDSIHEGTRQIYRIDCSELLNGF